MKLLGKLTGVSFGSNINHLSFKNLKNAEGLSFSSNDDIKRNTCSITFKEVITKPLELGQEYELILVPENEKIDKNLTNIFSSYKLYEAELGDDERTATYKFTGQNCTFTISASVDLIKYKTGDVISLFLNV